MEISVKHYDELTKEELYDILAVRIKVFVEEQRCAYQELDYHDQTAFHVMALDEKGKIIGYLRVSDKGMDYEDVMIGHILSLNRKTGIASKLLEVGIGVAREKFGAEKVVVEVQTYVKHMFEKQGFKKDSPEYYIDGIPYVLMSKEFE